MLNLARLDQMIAEDRLIRYSYFFLDDDGRERACLWASVAPDGANRTDPETCPAEDCPTWLARLLPWIDDTGTVERWPEFIRRTAAFLHRLPQIDPELLRRADYVCRMIGVNFAKQSAFPPVDAVLALLQRAAKGDFPSEEEWKRARKAAHEAWVDGFGNQNLVAHAATTSHRTRTSYGLANVLATLEPSPKEADDLISQMLTVLETLPSQ